MNHYHWNVSGRQPVAVHERPLTTDGVASFRTAPSSRAHRPRAGAHASERACHEFAIRARTKGHGGVSQYALFSLACAESCPLSSLSVRVANLYHSSITLYAMRRMFVVLVRDVIGHPLNAFPKVPFFEIVQQSLYR